MTAPTATDREASSFAVEFVKTIWKCSRCWRINAWPDNEECGNRKCSNTRQVSDSHRSLAELAADPAYQCSACCGAPPWAHTTMGQCNECHAMCRGSFNLPKALGA